MTEHDDSWEANLKGGVRPLRRKARAESDPDVGVIGAKRIVRDYFRRRPYDETYGLVPPAADPDDKDRPATLRKRADAYEARLDLHGLPEAEAHRLLIGFVAQSRALGLTRLLVVTGKGKDPGGALKLGVPRWLEVPPLAQDVLSWKIAAPRHGGEGALTLRLKP